MKGYKGFDEKLKCKDFQYEIGKEYEHKGEIKACKSGFHFCENPLDVFGYYPPSNSRYCEVDGDGETDTDNTDSKVAASRLKVGVEIGLPGLIKAGVEYIKSKVDWESAATNTGYRSAATNTGDQSAATNTGDQSAATNTGYRSAASVEGEESIACGLGIKNKVKGSLGSWLVLAEWYLDDNCNWHIKEVKTIKVDGEIIKPHYWYELIEGEFAEVIL